MNDPHSEDYTIRYFSRITPIHRMRQLQTYDRLLSPEARFKASDLLLEAYENGRKKLLNIITDNDREAYAEFQKIVTFSPK